MVRLLAAIWIAIAFAASASAGIILTIDQPVRDADRNDWLLYTGSFTYTGERDIELWGIGFYAPSGFVSDFREHVYQESMSPGSTYTGDLFSFRIDDMATYETHTARIDVAGYDPITHTMVVDSQFVTVNVVPEPATLLVLAPAMGLLFRRRRLAMGVTMGKTRG
ncbi:MAG: hypothetical protein ACAH95_11995 [Fimbriimonas sp.]